MQWNGRRAVVMLPEHVGLSNAGQIRDELLSVINGGATGLVVDMTATISCDHAGADALAGAYQRAVISGTEFRLVLTAQIVRHVLSVSGLDRLVSVYPSLEAATAAWGPSTAIPPTRLTRVAGPPPHRVPAPGHPHSAMSSGGRRAAITPAVIWKLIDALNDGVALADHEGMLALANRRLEEMFGYEHAELADRPVESLIPADLQAAHRTHRAAYALAPRARPMGAGARLVGLRKDGSTFPVQISLSPVPTATGHFTMTIIRDITEARRLEDLADLAREAVAAEHANYDRALLDTITSRIYRVGLSLQSAPDLPAERARQVIGEALSSLDDMLQEIRAAAFTTPDAGSPP